MQNQDQRLFELQEQLYHYTKARAFAYIGDSSEELRRYQAHHEQFSRQNFSIIKRPDFYKVLQKSDIILLGDFHSFGQSSRNLERILKKLYSTNKDYALGVEFVKIENQSTIDAYLNGYITELEFLESIDYQNSWKFPWNHYKSFLSYCKENKIPVVALNSDGILSKRDRNAAMRVQDYLKKNPDKSMIIFFGELHLVHDKLPRYLSQALQDQLNPSHESYKITTIHQNLDHVFWTLHKLKKHPRLGQRDTIVQFNDHEFSIQSSPPWIKYESIIYWYEHILDDPHFELHEYIMESGLSFNSTVPDTFVFLTEKIIEALGIEVSSFDIEDFNIYDHQKIDLIEKKIFNLPENYHNYYFQLLKRGRIFKLPLSKDYYCSNYSINRVAFLAGIHLQTIAMEKKYGEEFYPIEDNVFSHPFLRFNFLIKQMVTAYFCSKILNPFRKCNHYLDWKQRVTELEKDGPQGEIEVLRCCILIFDSIPEKTLNQSIYQTLNKLDDIQIYYCIKICGHALGELLYQQHYLKELHTFQEILKRLFTLQSDKDKAQEDIEFIMSNIIPSRQIKKLLKRAF